MLHTKGQLRLTFFRVGIGEYLFTGGRTPRTVFQTFPCVSLRLPKINAPAGACRRLGPPGLETQDTFAFQMKKWLKTAIEATKTKQEVK